ncbi:tyrosine-type recombinase/integrase [Bacteroides congonensis]|uniref:tyrosine-type recombinase/integrase n=1 Tax=Bacteroides congonensis TaxID=1871006 RepID=UPI0026747EA4|nr:tyrosine-type recombinase/integrase [Bacteroides congonensis]
MQNTVYECKQNGEDFFLSLSVTYSRFGNCPANGLVTEQPQYSVVVCIFSTSQNTEISLIPNGLRLIYTCSLLLALPCIFHTARHTWATTAYQKKCATGVICNALGHSSVKVTETYLKAFEQKEIDRTNRMIISYIKKEAEKGCENQYPTATIL